MCFLCKQEGEQQHRPFVRKTMLVHQATCHLDVLFIAVDGIETDITTI